MQEILETQVQSLDQQDPLEGDTATYSNILVGRILWAEEPGGLQSIGLQSDRHQWSNLAHILNQNKKLNINGCMN